MPIPAISRLSIKKIFSGLFLPTARLCRYSGVKSIPSGSGPRFASIVFIKLRPGARTWMKPNRLLSLKRSCMLLSSSNRRWSCFVRGVPVGKSPSLPVMPRWTIRDAPLSIAIRRNLARLSTDLIRAPWIWFFKYLRGMGRRSFLLPATMPSTLHPGK